VFEAGGRALGGMAGKALGTIFGSGAYSVRGNTLHTNTVPQFALTKNGSEFAHREFVADIFSAPTLSGIATPFNLQQFVINPANEVLFPWIQQVALNFEMYELLGLIFEFVPSSGNAVSSTNAALGTVIFATQYNSLDAPFISKRQMESYEFATSTVPSMPMMHPVECANQSNTLTTLYVNNPGAQSIAGDPRFSDIGILNIATVGQQAANANLGELWVTAHIRFKRPRLAPAAYNAYFNNANTNQGQNVFFAQSYQPSTNTAFTNTIAGIVINNLTTAANSLQIVWPVGYKGTFLMTFQSSTSTAGIWSGAQSALSVSTSGDITQQILFANGSAFSSNWDSLPAGTSPGASVYGGGLCFQSLGTQGGVITLTKTSAGPNTVTPTGTISFTLIGPGISS